MQKKSFHEISEETPRYNICLNCDEDFLAISKFNRVCSECKAKPDFTDEAEEPN